MTNTDIVSPSNGGGLLTRVLNRNRRVYERNTVPEILRNIINGMGVTVNPLPAHSNSKVLRYLHSASAHDVVKNDFPTRPIPLIISKAGKLVFLAPRMRFTPIDLCYLCKPNEAQATPEIICAIITPS